MYHRLCCKAPGLVFYKAFPLKTSQCLGLSAFSDEKRYCRLDHSNIAVIDRILRLFEETSPIRGIDKK